MKPTDYSLFNLVRRGVWPGTAWPPAWRSVKPGLAYDVVIIGGGGHGLATAYYLAAQYGVSRVAVLEKGWIGGGNTGRTHPLAERFGLDRFRSNRLVDESAAAGIAH